MVRLRAVIPDKRSAIRDLVEDGIPFVARFRRKAGMTTDNTVVPDALRREVPLCWSGIHVERQSTTGYHGPLTSGAALHAAPHPG